MVKYFILLLSVFFVITANSQDVVTLRQIDKNLKAIPGKNTAVKLQLKIEKGWHINSIKPNEDYLIPAKLTMEDRNDAKLLSVDFPKNAAKEIKLGFSDSPISVYEDEVFVTLNLQLSENFNFNKKLNIKFEYQACNNSTCIAPSELELPLILLPADAIVKATDSGKDSVNIVPQLNKSEQLQSEGKSSNKEIDRPKENRENSNSGLFDENNMFLSLLLIFLAGLGLNLTPCVYPLIMITVGFFGAQSESRISRLFILSLFYVVGISIMYSVLGVVASMTGGIFGSALQNPIVIIILSGMLIAMALSMFGLFEIQLPPSLMNKVGSSRSGYFGALLMGLTMGIAAAPCVGPVIISLLTVVGNKGDIFFGFIIFFTLSLGLGLPYLFLGMFSGRIKNIPRSGEWMIGVKKIFGIIILALAIYFLNPLIGEPYSNFTIPIFLIQGTLYLAFLDKSGESSKGFKVIKYIFILIIFNYSLFSIIPKDEPRQSNDWVKPNTMNFLELGQPVVLDFYADWCIPCKELDKFTFSDQKVIDKMKNFKKYKLDLTKSNDKLTSDLTSKFQIKGVPTIILFDKQLKEIKRINGFIEAEEFIKELDLVK